MNERAKFEVPMNWGEDYLSFLLDKSDMVDSVYGSLPGEATGRPIPHKLDQQEGPDLKKLKSVVERLKLSGIGFSLVMNASCTGNTLFTDVGKETLQRQIKTLRDAGVEDVIVANFDLARRLSAIDPNIKILMSVIFNITEPDQLLYLRKQDFNFSGLVVGKGLNRNLPKLENFLQLASDLKTIVIANDFCPIPNCPERITDHNNACAHKNLPFDPALGEQQYVSPSLHCRRVVLKDPALHLKAPVINPNDLSLYEKIGVRLFKLTDRIMPDKLLMDVCSAYFQRKYRGNLFDLFSYTSDLSGSTQPQKVLTPKEVGAILAEGYSSQLANKRHFLAKPKLDSEKLSESEFMNMFIMGRCKNLCHDEVYNPNGCKHCENYTSQFLEIDPDEIRIAARNIELLIASSRKQITSLPLGQRFDTQTDIEWGETDETRLAHIKDTHEILKRSQRDNSNRYGIAISGENFVVFPAVFSPSYFNDTEFFADNIPISPGDSFLEIGAGTGIISILALKKGATSALALDINPVAVENSAFNAGLHGVENRMRCKQSDVYESVEDGQKFDKIFWNAPFGLVSVPLTILEKSVFDEGYEDIRRFILEAKDYLVQGGKLLLGFSSVMGDLSLIEKFTEEAGAKSMKIVAQKVQHDGRQKPLTFEIFEIVF